MEGLIGKKIGMTQIFDETGKRVCVTVIEVGPCPVVQVKTLEKDGYVAAQLGFGVQKLWKDPEADKEAHGGRRARNRMTKAESGHLTKTGGLTAGVRVLKEFAPDAGEEVKVYKTFLKENSYINLKTDSDLLYDFTLEVVKEAGYPIIYNYTDLYANDDELEVKTIRTYYESMWLKQGLTIKYLKFKVK